VLPVTGVNLCHGGKFTAVVGNPGGKIFPKVYGGKFAAGVNDDGGEFTTEVDDANGEFAAGVNDTNGHQYSKQISLEVKTSKQYCTAWMKEL
jgi:hypothetical protein